MALIFPAVLWRLHSHLSFFQNHHSLLFLFINRVLISTGGHKKKKPHTKAKCLGVSCLLFRCRSLVWVRLIWLWFFQQCYGCIRIFHSFRIIRVNCFFLLHARRVLISTGGHKKHIQKCLRVSRLLFRCHGLIKLFLLKWLRKNFQLLRKTLTTSLSFTPDDRKTIEDTYVNCRVWLDRINKKNPPFVLNSSVGSGKNKQLLLCKLPYHFLLRENSLSKKKNWKV